MANYEWETSKENVGPLRRGRNTDVLNAVLVAPQPDLEREKCTHLAAIQDAINGCGPLAEDPLASFVIFAKWAVEHYPAGSPVILEAIEKPCRRFAKDNRYQDDIRFARLWVRYAELRDDKLDVFEYMRRNGIGKTCTVVYEAWAMTLELARQYEIAEQVYNLGRENCAQPEDLLFQREREFRKRQLARHRRAAAKKQEKSVHNKIDRERAVRDTTRHRASATEELVRSDAGAKHSPKAAVRPALGSLTETEAQTGHRPFTSSQMTRTLISLGLSDTKQDGKIQVFEDRNVSSELSFIKTESDDDLPKPMIARRDAVSKEDEGLPTKWAGETLRQNVMLASRFVNHNPFRSFDIYEGPECEKAPTVAMTGEGICGKNVSELQNLSHNSDDGPSSHIENVIDTAHKVVCDEDSLIQLAKGGQHQCSFTVPLENSTDPDNPAKCSELEGSALPLSCSPILISSSGSRQIPPSPAINKKNAVCDASEAVNTTLSIERFCVEGTVQNDVVPLTKPSRVSYEREDEVSSENNPRALFEPASSVQEFVNVPEPGSEQAQNFEDIRIPETADLNEAHTGSTCDSSVLDGEEASIVSDPRMCDTESESNGLPSATLVDQYISRITDVEGKENALGTASNSHNVLFLSEDPTLEARVLQQIYPGPESRQHCSDDCAIPNDDDGGDDGKGMKVCTNVSKVSSGPTPSLPTDKETLKLQSSGVLRSWGDANMMM